MTEPKPLWAKYMHFVFLFKGLLRSRKHSFCKTSDKRNKFIVFTYAEHCHLEADRQNLEDGIPLMLLYVLESKGSSPGRQGFFMVVNANGDSRVRSVAVLWSISLWKWQRSGCGLLVMSCRQQILKDRCTIKRRRRIRAG